jgi:hypothetical protein
VASGPAGSSPILLSPDYKDDGGKAIWTIQSGARILVSQTDIPQAGVTVDNYASNVPLLPSGAAGQRIVVIGGRKTFQYELQNFPWFDSTNTVFFRDDGTRVSVTISYPSGRGPTRAAEYAQILASLVIE